MRPFLLSCASKNPKFAGTSISCLQRLVVSNGLAQETLKDVLDVLRDCTTLGQDIQLRILQVLPSLLQNYAGYLTGDLLATALHICFTLLLSKAAVISNTAAATSQQLVVAVLGKVALEDEIPSEEDFVAEVPLENGSVNVRSAALDAYRLLNDLCLLTEGGHKPMFLHPTAMPSNFGLELIESMLSNHAETVASHAEQIHVLRVRLMPYIIRVLSERVMFSTTVRAMRLLPIIFSKLLIVLPTECEMVLSLLNHMLDPEAASLWKRVLCMEVFRGVHADASLVRSVYAQFDELEGKRDIVRDNLAIVSRLAMEKPAIIGFGQQSTVPVSSVQAEEEVDDMAILQAEGMAGTIGVAMTLRSSTAPGISTRLSTMRVPCLDQLDKADPPTIPPAYLYTLALICMNSFSDGIARFLLPFTIPPDMKSKRKQRPPKETTDGENDTDSTQKTQLQRSQSNASSKIPVNPLSLTDNVLHSQIQTSANMIDSCWPALLAAYSTFFNAALDSDFYHALVRSFQKFTQVSGLLRASTPRDAFLTTLGKNAVPSSILPVQSVSEIKDPKRGVQTPLEKEVGTPNTRLSTESARTSLNTRNLLCLRALLNLGIALGPVLQSAWSIILETLQQADLIINYIIAQRRQSRTGQSNANINDPDLQGDIGNEITAVRKAATKLLESSNELPDESFLDIISSLSGLIRDLQGELDTISSDGLKSSSLIRPPTHSRSSSNTGIGYSSGQDPRANLFVVENIGKLIEFNKPRLLEKPPEESGWHIIANSLINVVAAQHLDPSLRKRASETLGELISLTASSDLLESIREQTRLEGLSALRRQVECLYRKTTEDNKASKVCENEIHWMSLEVLRSALEQYGDSLVSGWENVFAIISSVFGDSLSSSSTISEATARPEKARTKSSKLVRSSFGSLQLICSDFLPSVPRACFPTLLRTVQLFCIQEDEFNISLTVS